MENQLLQSRYQGNRDGAVGQRWALLHVLIYVRTPVGCCSDPALHHSQCLCPGGQPLWEAVLEGDCHLHP